MNYRQRNMMYMCTKLASMMEDGLLLPCADSFRRKKW